MLKIGDFSKLSRISIRMLRYYDTHDILKPRLVDEVSGYRFYAHEQVLEAAKIRFLKEAGFSVAMMHEILHNLQDTAMIAAYFHMHECELEKQQQEISNALIRLQRAQELLEKENTFMNYEVEVKTIPGMYAATLRNIIPCYEKEDLLWKKLYSYVREYHLDIAFAQPQNARAYFYDEGFKEREVDVEIATEVVQPHADVEDLKFRQLKEETVASVTFQGGYEQITDVCIAISLWIKDHSYELDGPNFCIYHKGWGMVDNPEAFITEICYPIRKA